MKNYVTLRGNLFNITIELDNDYIERDSILTELRKICANSEELEKNCESIEISRGIKELRDDCFSNYEKLKIVHLPDTITQIYQSAFANCSNIQQIYISERFYASGYDELKIIFGENIEKKIVLVDLGYSDELVRTLFEEFKVYGESRKSKEKYMVYKYIKKEMISKPLREQLQNSDFYKVLDAKFSMIVDFEEETPPNESNEVEVYILDLMIRIADGPGHYSEEEKEIFDRLYRESKGKL